MKAEKKIYYVYAEAVVSMDIMRRFKADSEEDAIELAKNAITEEGGVAKWKMFHSPCDKLKPVSEPQNFEASDKREDWI